MSKSLTVVIPHELGADEAVRRISAGIAQIQSEFGGNVTLAKANWNANSLAFTIRTLGSRLDGSVEVADDFARVETVLPWFLMPFAGTAENLVLKYGVALLGND